MEIASRLEFRPRAVKLELEHLDKLVLPAMLHWDMNHFMVLTEVRKKTLVVHDPARGRRVCAAALGMCDRTSKSLSHPRSRGE